MPHFSVLLFVLFLVGCVTSEGVTCVENQDLIPPINKEAKSMLDDNSFSFGSNNGFPFPSDVDDEYDYDYGKDYEDEDEDEDDYDDNYDTDYDYDYDDSYDDDEYDEEYDEEDDDWDDW